MSHLAKMGVNNYQPYSSGELYVLLHQPREVSNSPYKLHAAFMLSCLYESLDPEDEDDTFEHEAIWGKAIPCKVFESILKNANEQFQYALQDGGQIDIWDKPYTIRNSGKCDTTRLLFLFDFPVKDGEYLIVPEGVMNLDSEYISENNKKELYRQDREFVRKVVYLAEDDENDGWNKLTDMEVAVYLWVVFCAKHKEHSYTAFRKKYKGELYTTLKEESKCWSHIRKKDSIYLFSSDLVRKWNIDNGQKSHVDDVKILKADDYWYDKYAV